MASASPVISDCPERAEALHLLLVLQTERSVQTAFAAGDVAAVRDALEPCRGHEELSELVAMMDAWVALREAVNACDVVAIRATIDACRPFPQLTSLVTEAVAYLALMDAPDAESLRVRFTSRVEYEGLGVVCVLCVCRLPLSGPALLV
jgi:hypothetical protein